MRLCAWSVLSLTVQIISAVLHFVFNFLYRGFLLHLRVNNLTGIIVTHYSNLLRYLFPLITVWVDLFLVGAVNDDSDVVGLDLVLRRV